MTSRRVAHDVFEPVSHVYNPLVYARGQDACDRYGQEF